jgi:excisionase family DNA binding protein
MAATRTKRRPSQPGQSGSIANAVDAFQVLTLPEAAAFLRVSEAALLLLAANREVPGRRIGSEWRFSKTALQDWLSAAPPRKGLLSRIGALRDDPHREEMLKEIYTRRGRSEAEGS